MNLPNNISLKILSYLDVFDSYSFMKYNNKILTKKNIYEFIENFFQRDKQLFINKISKIKYIIPKNNIKNINSDVLDVSDISIKIISDKPNDFIQGYINDVISYSDIKFNGVIKNNKFATFTENNNQLHDYHDYIKQTNYEYNPSIPSIIETTEPVKVVITKTTELINNAEQKIEDISILWNKVYPIIDKYIEINNKIEKIVENLENIFSFVKSISIEYKELIKINDGKISLKKYFINCNKVFVYDKNLIDRINLLFNKNSGYVKNKFISEEDNFYNCLIHNHLNNFLIY